MKRPSYRLELWIDGENMLGSPPVFGEVEGPDGTALYVEATPDNPHQFKVKITRTEKP